MREFPPYRISQRVVALVHLPEVLKGYEGELTYYHDTGRFAVSWVIPRSGGGYDLTEGWYNADEWLKKVGPKIVPSQDGDMKILK